MEDYKEKYENALKVMGEIYESVSVDRDYLSKNSYLAEKFEQAFPELRESEDEKIRKAIIDVFKSHCDYEVYYGISVDKILAWLEKQEPEHRFKAGDWIIRIDGKTEPSQIIYVGERYETDDGFLVFDLEHLYRLWSVFDAKPGAVLYNKDEKTSDSIFIFRGMSDGTGKLLYYTRLSDLTEFSVSSEDCWIDGVFGGEFYPATKEQKEMLFSKMKEHGYEWDAEKLELRKIEQSSAEWSEEDDANINRVLHFLQGGGLIRGQREQLTNWLKSLRPHWKPSESDILLLERIAQGKSEPKDFQASLDGIIEQLKKL